MCSIHKQATAIGELILVPKAKRVKIGNFLLPNSPTYVVAGDSAKTRIFLTERRYGDWTEVATLSNRAASIRERDWVTDRPGRAFDSFGKGRHAMTPEETAREHQLHRFAHDVGSFLNKGITSGDCRHLVLIVEPTFLGHLRQELSATASKSLLYELPMNTTGYDVARLKSLFT